MAEFKADIGGWIPDEIKRMARADAAVRPIMKQAVYAGADVILNAVKSVVSSHGSLSKGLDCATMRVNADSVDTVIGFGGYDENNTPYPLIANTLEYGTSHGHDAQPFFAKTVKSNKAAAQAAMMEVFHREITKIIGE